MIHSDFSADSCMGRRPEHEFAEKSECVIQQVMPPRARALPSARVRVGSDGRSCARALRQRADERDRGGRRRPRRRQRSSDDIASSLGRSPACISLKFCTRVLLKVRAATSNFKSSTRHGVTAAARLTDSSMDGSCRTQQHVRAPAAFALLLASGQSATDSTPPHRRHH
jgi:hypothetical protein